MNKQEFVFTRNPVEPVGYVYAGLPCFDYVQRVRPLITALSQVPASPRVPLSRETAPCSSRESGSCPFFCILLQFDKDARFFSPGAFLGDEVSAGLVKGRQDGVQILVTDSFVDNLMFHVYANDL